MAHDARISVTLPAHPKTKKLLRRHGPATTWGLVCLFLWAAANRPDGDLSGMTDEDIELAVDWAGAEGALVAALRDVGFLDGESGNYSIHDWTEHNPWAAGSRDRSEASKYAALCKRYGKDRAAEMMPDYAPRMRPAHEPHADGTEAQCDPDAVAEKPQCPVTVTVTDTVSKPPVSPKGDRFTAEFTAFWQAYPSKIGKDAAWKAWRKRSDRPPLPEILAALQRYAATKPPEREWCNPATWLNQGRWQDGVSASAAEPEKPADPWRPRMTGWSQSPKPVDQRWWHPDWGEPPHRPGTKVPVELLREFKLIPEKAA